MTRAVLLPKKEMSASDLSFFHHRGHYGTLNENPKSKESLTLFQLGSLDSSDSIHSRDTGSEWVGAALNLTNSTVGAGCIGLGGAIAHSGGLVSLLALTVFAVLSKYSLDLVVNLSLESQDVRASYESLGFLTYGPRGEFAIILSKGLYSFGCLVAYIVIIKDNLAHAILHLSHLDNADNLMGTWLGLLTNQYFVTVFLCTTIMLPLCMLRNVSPLERFSAFKILVVMLIVVIIIYLFLASEKQQPSFVDHWLVIHPGIFER